MASGLVLPRHEDTLARERSLFYACVSRPEEALFLSFRSSDEEGAPQQPSPFLDDVRALFTDELWTQRGRRLLAEVTWTPAEAPTPHELRRAYAAVEEQPAPAPLAAPADATRARAAGRPRPRVRARPGDVRRLPGEVDDRARPAAAAGRSGPGADEARLARPRRAGAHAARPEGAHRLGRLAPETLDEALNELRVAIGELSAAARTVAGRAAARALEVDLERYIRHEAANGAGYEPTQLEWSFDDFMIDGVAVSGRVDRVDTRGCQRDRPRLQGPHRPRRRALGRGRQDPGRAVRAGRARALRRARSPARSTSRSAPPTSARAGSSATTSRAATSTATSATTSSSTRA